MIIHHRRMCSFAGTVIHCLQHRLAQRKQEQPRPLPSSGPEGSEAFEGFFELTVHEVGIYLGGGHVAMPQGPLHHEQVVGRAVEVGGEGMPQPVRRQFLFDPGLPQPVGEPVGNLPLAESAVPVRQEQGFHFPGGRVDVARPGNGAAMCGGRS